MSKATAPVCSVDGGRLLDWSDSRRGADYYCPAPHGAKGAGLWFRTVWSGTGHGSTFSIDLLPGQDARPYMTPGQKDDDA